MGSIRILGLSSEVRFGLIRGLGITQTVSPRSRQGNYFLQPKYHFKKESNIYFW